MPTDNDDPSSAELAKDIQDLKNAAPDMYAQLEQRLGATAQASAARFVNEIQAIPFQTCVQIMLGTKPEHSTMANEVLEMVKRLFRNLEPFQEGPDLNPAQVTPNNLQQNLNEVLDDYDLVAKVGPFQLVQGITTGYGRSNVSVHITAHPRTAGKPNWIDMHFTAFADSLPGAWSALRIRINNLLSV